MRSRSICVCIFLGMALTAAGRGADGKSAVSLDGEYPRLVQRSLAMIRDALKDKPNRRSADRARVAAMMIAAAAQHNLAGPDSGRRATQRDAALAIADLIKDEDFAKARKGVETLAGLKADARAKKEKIQLLGPRLDVEDLMMPYRPIKVGGLELEARFDQLGSQANGSIAAKDLTGQLVLDAYWTVVTAEVAEEHVPKAKPGEWLALAREMRKQSLALGLAAMARDGPGSFRAIGQLNRTCNRCHQAFRNN